MKWKEGCGEGRGIIGISLKTKVPKRFNKVGRCLSFLSMLTNIRFLSHTYGEDFIGIKKTHFGDLYILMVSPMIFGHGDILFPTKKKSFKRKVGCELKKG